MHRCTHLTLWASSEPASIALTDAFQSVAVPRLMYLDVDLKHKETSSPVHLFSPTPLAAMHHLWMTRHFTTMPAVLLSGVRQLHLDSLPYMGWPDLCHTLQSMPQLTWLHLAAASCAIGTDSMADRRCELRRLTHLEAQLWGSSGVRLLRALHAPDLLTLFLRIENALDFNSVVYSCMPGYSKLKHLTLCVTFNSVSLIRDMLAFLPALSHLDVTGCPAYTSFAFTRLLIDNAASTAVHSCALPGLLCPIYVDDLLKEFSKFHSHFECFYHDRGKNFVLHKLADGVIYARKGTSVIDFFYSM
ncbi:hypothetical protein C8R43DRAFT_1118964 [Mycena crocata]|nr:hypothetical protein C8R43DRAFT_1118964 [Mycena crocata]